jgi:hypothetical protein
VLTVFREDFPVLSDLFCNLVSLFSCRSVKNDILTQRHHVQTDSEVHATSYPVSTGGYFSGGKAAGV